MAFSELAAEFSAEATSLLDELEAELISLESSLTADMRSDVARRIRRALHTLKGNAGLLGAPVLHSALHRLEDGAGDLEDEPARGAWLLGALDVIRDEINAIASGRAVDAASEAVRELAEGELAGRDGGNASIGPALSANEVRVPREQLDQLLAATGELVVIQTQLHRLLSKRLDEGQQAFHWMDRLDRTSRLLHDLVLKARTLPVRTLFARFGRLVHDDAARHGRTARLELGGEQVQADRVVLEALGAPLMHLVRNAVIHGLESPEDRVKLGKPRTGTITLRARSAGERVFFLIADDGRGLDAEKIRARARELGAPPGLDPEQLIFLPGFSTASLSEGAGRGVGLDVVARSVVELGGTIEVRSQPGQGTTFELSVPASLALQRAVLCAIGEEIFAIPASSIVEAVRAERHRSRWLGRGRGFDHGGRLVPLVDCARLLGATPSEDGYVLVLDGGGQVALPVDALLGQQDFVFQPLDAAVGGDGPANGTALLGDGRVVLRLDPERLKRHSLQTEVRP